MSTHPNSTAALKGTALIRYTRRKEILLAVRASNGPVTDRQIAYLLNKSDMNAVRPRITELISDGLLKETGWTKCPITDRQVRLVGLPPSTSPAL